MKRRTFLTLAGGAGAAVMVGPWIGRSSAATFGAFPNGTGSVQLPDGQRAKKVLEVFLYGGLSPWETLYYVRDYGTASDPQYPNTQYYALSQTQALTQCGQVDQARPFANDANTAMVELGPFAHRLYARSDVTARMRLVVQRHDLEPHEAAVPMALTGRPVGQPNAAGLGAHVQRARIDSGATPGRASPHSYVFATGGISSDNVAAAAASGNHPGSARPLLIKTDNASRFTNLLSRPTVGTANKQQHDSLVGADLDQYNSRLTFPNHGRVRSARTDDFTAAFNTVKNADALSSVLTSDLFMARNSTSCGVSDQSLPLMGLTAAVKLLTNTSEPASYVCVSDTGLYEASGGGGYDTHTDNAVDTAVNFDNMLQSLLGMINTPGENNPAKISLDDTLVILNTEFGRTPGRQGSNGRNHHPRGYVTAFIGGPVTTVFKGVSGAIGRDGEASPSKFASPSENRMAALLALGIWPFAAEGFNVADSPGAIGELDAAQKAMTKFLGRTL
ncbi:hypothetical protein BH11MYX3_BH11MYX3_25170 [soil metagenome]